MTNENSPAVWQDEVALIKIAAAKCGVDWYFIAAIRLAEHGRTNPEYDAQGNMIRESRAFGVLSAHAPTYAEQLNVCCRSVNHRLREFQGTKVISHEIPDGSEIPVYSRDFVDWFGSIWAPQGAENDPSGLNANWARNVWYAYLNLIDQEHSEPTDEEEIT